jgi:hypothetical protein
MSVVVDLLERQWEICRQRPFWRLVEVFVARIFRGGGDSDSEGMDLGIGLVLTLLAMPGGFVSILLFNKYGSLLQWLRGQSNVDTLSIAFPDEYFFIVLSMTVTGAVAVWRWDAIFPDRRDYINLVPLPISIRTIFFANLLAVVFLIAVIAFDVNMASCILFPTVVAAAQPTILFALKFAAVHALGVIAASIFAFLGVFFVLGLMMALLPPRAFRRASSYVRGIVAVYLVAMLCTSFVVPELLRQLRGPAPVWTWFMPSCWFVGLCQSLRDRSTPALLELSRLPLPAIVAFALLAFGMYAISYRRHFVRIGEMSEGGISIHSRSSRVSTWLDRVILKTPFQKACFRFVRSTLLRSEAHRLVLTGIGGLGLVLASQALMESFDRAKSARQVALTPGALSLPFILSFVLILGLRLVFEMPAELRANWLFQLMVDSDRQESEPLARKVILLALVPATVAILFPTYVYLAGIVVATIHTVVVLTWAVLLTNVVLLRFRKLPFTCTMPVFKQHSIVIAVTFCFGYLLYAVSTPQFESSAMVHPLRFVILIPIATAAWCIPHYVGKNTMEFDRKLIFEEAGPRTVELLRLSE